MQKWTIILQSFVFKIIQNVYEENVFCFWLKQRKLKNADSSFCELKLSLIKLCNKVWKSKTIFYSKWWEKNAKCACHLSWALRAKMV